MDDHSLFRDSLSRLLESEPGLVIAGSCARVSEALEILIKDRIDVVLLDYDLGDEQGTVLLEESARRGLSSRFLMVTAGLGGAGTLRAFQNGSAGVFLKHSSPTQLVEAIRKVAAGEVWLDSRAVQGLVSGATSRAAETLPGATLTARERAVVKAVFEGLSNKEIGARLELSESSVKTVLQQLFDKAGVRTRSQLVRIALEQHADDWLSDRS